MTTRSSTDRRPTRSSRTWSTLAGGDAVTTSDPAVFSIPVEQLIVADPEVIVLGDAAYGVCPSTVAARPGWAGITAVKDGAIRPVNDTIVTRPGPRLADGLASLTRAIHPELADELAGFPADPPMCVPHGRSRRRRVAHGASPSGAP